MKSYSIVDTHAFLGTGEESKKYIYTVRDLPNEYKPREKLSRLGARSLTSHELLAIILATGTKREGVLGMCHRILKEYGEKPLSSAKDVKKLAAELDIPLIKAMQIVACFELGRRFFQKKDEQMPTLRTARDVFDYLLDMRSLPKEHLRGLYLNSHYKLIHDEVISIGTTDASIIHPREVFRPALECGAVAVILAHNHPSGDTTPSRADMEITSQLIEAGRLMGIRILDHIVVGKTGFVSIEADYK